MIEFICDADATFGEPELVSVDAEICIVRFEWRTVSACVPDVIIQDENAEYNEFVESCQLTQPGNLSGTFT